LSATWVTPRSRSRLIDASSSGSSLTQVVLSTGTLSSCVSRSFPRCTSWSASLAKPPAISWGRLVGT